LFIPDDEIEATVLRDLIDKAFENFDSDRVLELVKIDNGCQILELFHGPTLACKDISLSCVGQLFDHFTRTHGSRCMALVATAGDTGSAAIAAVKGLAAVDIIVLLPRGRCTRVQELQMTTAIADNVHVFRVDGTSDDLDEPIKRCFSDPEFVTRHRLCSINSINWTRVLVQVIQYFYAYLQVRPNCNGEVEIVVPTGAGGNIAAGCIASQMGLPIQLVVAVNSNDIVARLIATGTYSITGPIIPSLACAMDIQVAYNVERMLWSLTNGDTTLVRQLMETFERCSNVTIPQQLHDKMRRLIGGHVVSDEDIKSTMKRCFAENKYIVCPHTATALHYHYTRRDETSGTTTEDVIPRVCLATASPAKFAEAVTSAGLERVDVELLESLSAKPTRYSDWERGEDWYDNIRKYIEKVASLKGQ